MINLGLFCYDFLQNLRSLYRGLTKNSQPTEVLLDQALRLQDALGEFGDDELISLGEKIVDHLLFGRVGNSFDLGAFPVPIPSRVAAIASLRLILIRLYGEELQRDFIGIWNIA